MNPSKGFTLAEMAIAVVILALLLFGAMVPFSAQVEIRNVADTRRTMDSIKEAILGFAQANGRLPCPADGSIPSGKSVNKSYIPTPPPPGSPPGSLVVTAGSELFEPYPPTGSARCLGANGAEVVFGVIPWATLGVPEADAWGRRLSYQVAPAFADAISLNTWQSRQNPVPVTFPSQNRAAFFSPADQNPTCPSSAPPAVAPFTLSPAPTLSSFALCTLGDIAVFTRAASAAVPLGAALPAVFISHGKNGLGAWQSNGIRLPLPAAGTDEAANVNGNTQATPTGGYASWAFYSRPPTPASAGCADPIPYTSSGAPLCEFDDTVVMISSNALVARMVAAGRLP